MTPRNMKNSNRSLLDRWFSNDEDRLLALENAYDVQIAHSISMARHHRKMTQHDLATELGVSQSYVAQLESAAVLPSHKKLKFLARIFKAKLAPPRIVIEQAELIPKTGAGYVQKVSLEQLIGNPITVRYSANSAIYGN